MNTLMKFALVLVVLSLIPTGTAQADGLFKQRHSLAPAKQLVCDAMSDLTECLNREGELEMIQLQSLISQRQQAVQMTTNMLYHLSGDGKGCVICQNIGK